MKATTWLLRLAYNSSKDIGASRRATLLASAVSRESDQLTPSADCPPVIATTVLVYTLLASDLVDHK